MADALRVPVDEILHAVALLFGGLFAGVVLAPLLTARIRLARVVALGAGLQACGAGAAATAPGVVEFLVCCAVVGLGFGVTESAGVALAPALAPRAAERVLTALTACVALAAASTPVLVAVLGVRTALGLVAAMHVAAAGALALAKVDVRPATPASVGRRSLGGAVVVGGALFGYVGAESVLAGWSAVTAQRELGVDGAWAALGTSAFWILLTVGRLAAVLVLANGAEPGLLVVRSLAATASLLAAATALEASAVPVALGLTALAVIACGPCYALLMGLGLRAAASASTTTTSAALVAAGALGGALLPAAATVLDASTALLPALAASAATGAAVMARHRVGGRPLPAAQQA